MFSSSKIFAPISLLNLAHHERSDLDGIVIVHIIFSIWFWFCLIKKQFPSFYNLV